MNITYDKNELEPMRVERPLPTDLEVEDEDEALLLLVDEGDWLLPPVAVASVPVPETVEVDLVEVEEGNKLEGSVTLAHERSYSGDVLNVASLLLVPTRPKLGFGAVGAASCRTYHQVLTLSKADTHPTSSQYVWALDKLAMARFSALPLTGHPVSVIQTGFPPAAADVASYAAQKSE